MQIENFQAKRECITQKPTQTKPKLQYNRYFNTLWQQARPLGINVESWALRWQNKRIRQLG